MSYFFRSVVPMETRIKRSSNIHPIDLRAEVAAPVKITDYNDLNKSNIEDVMSLSDYNAYGYKIKHFNSVFNSEFGMQVLCFSELGQGI